MTLRERIEAERAAADLNGYYDGGMGTREDYEKAKQATDQVVNALEIAWSIKKALGG